ncbi:MAG: hypothetical protein WBE26_02650 [Phycisphaerae bacterium]
MSATFHRWPCRLVVAVALGLSGSQAVAQEEETTYERTDVTTVEESSDSPFSFDLTYALYSDYIFRGINRSEYAGEGREKPNHQLDVSMSIDLGPLWGQDPGTCGTFGFGTWFEWYAAQKKLDPVDGGQNLQEVDYYLSWSYDVEPIATTFSLGYTFYTYPNAKAGNTSEWSLALDHNDAWMWKWLWPDNDKGILNPSFLFVQDVDVGAGNAIWMEIGLSHEFAMFPNVTMTPSWTLGIDHDYYHHFAGDPHKNTFRFANMLWGLDITYDMTELLRIPEGWGSVAMSGFLYFSDALGNAEDNGIIQDEFFGGMSVGWSF